MRLICQFSVFDVWRRPRASDFAKDPARYGTLHWRQGTAKIRERDAGTASWQSTGGKSNPKPPTWQLGSQWAASRAL
jgi:hypothetical protein